ncbi:MAG TPA: sulfite exporter TauE/SafE family protein [Cellvibrio sp.]|nr:sulfite exporter TauE/SafE family protein [Cellvibrio sp.]
MADLQAYQYVLIALIFVWSGFVRSGLGFGGAVMSLPFLLLIDNQPLVYLPIIAVHLLFFSSLTVWQNHRKNQQKLSLAEDNSSQGTIDWAYLKRSMKVMIIPKLIGVAGLLTIPASVMTGIIFAIVSVYSISYIANKPFKSKSPLLDKLFLILGAYISGTSLIGAPLIISVYSTHVAKQQLRDTLFVLWFILVVIKMCAFLYAGVDLQLIHHLWLLPAAAVGHVLGLRFHQKIVNSDPLVFYRVLGVSLLVVSVMGIASLFLK